MCPKLTELLSWNGPTVHVCCFMLARASTKTFVSRVQKTAKNLRQPKNSLAGSLVSRSITVVVQYSSVTTLRRYWPVEIIWIVAFEKPFHLLSPSARGADPSVPRSTRLARSDQPLSAWKLIKPRVQTWYTTLFPPRAEFQTCKTPYPPTRIVYCTDK